MTNDEQKAIQPLLDEVNNISKRAFKMADNIGFVVTFPNEWEVSVRWGKHHLCDGGKTTVEVAIHDPDDNWYTASWVDQKYWKLSEVEFGDTDVMGYVTPHQLTNILQEVAKQ